MIQPPAFEEPTDRSGLPADPGLAFDMLSDVLLNMVTVARKNTHQRDVLMGRVLTLIADLEEEAREVERLHPHWWGWAMLTVPYSDFGTRGSQK